MYFIEGTTSNRKVVGLSEESSICRNFRSKPKECKISVTLPSLLWGAATKASFTTIVTHNKMLMRKRKVVEQKQDVLSQMSRGNFTMTPE